MNIARYLPSTQFSLIVFSILAAGGLVLAAQYVTTPHPTAMPKITSSSTPTLPAPDANWQAALDAIQSQTGITAPAAPSGDTVNNLLTAAQSDNLTTTVGRTLLVNISAAKSQGLGSDIPTQDQLIAQASSQISVGADAHVYKISDLTTAPQTSDALKAYGNAVIAAISTHPSASYDATMKVVAQASDSGSSAPLSQLTAIGKDYQGLVKDLLAVPVPPTFAPFHLKVINDFSTMAASFTDMQAMIDDPLRGIAALQTYQSNNNEATRVFINIAQALNQQGILFNTSEPGAAWAQLLSAQ
ncbi:MAG TPA: hypothetical protein VG934_01920 [Candidatus Paceibacterota bacterium]|nr:hypothetical protein [Candidatus Paceibacterota bacterium]